MRSLSTKRLLILQGSQSLAILLSTSVFFPFLKSHFSFAEISLQSAVNYSAPILLLPFIRIFRPRVMMLTAFAIAIVRVLLAIHIHTLWDLHLNAFLAGIYLVLFWVPYEILYFKKQDVSTHGKSSAWYFGMMSTMGIIAPLVAGLVADHFGYPMLFFVSALCMLMPIALAWNLPDVRIAETLSASLRHLRRVSSLLIFDGFFLSIPTCLIALSLLSFTHSASQFGTIASLVSVVATLVSLGVADLSDRKQNRGMIIYPLTILSSLLLIILGLQKTLPSFVAILMIFTSLRTILQPVMNALPMDLCTDHTKLYIGRQFYISVGRVIGFGLTWFCAITVGLFPMYLTYAFGTVLYLAVVRGAISEKTI